MNLDGDEIYMKIVTFYEVYNFIVQTFSFEVILEFKSRYTIQIWIP
jgi:hypothetical protein